MKKTGESGDPVIHRNRRIEGDPIKGVQVAIERLKVKVKVGHIANRNSARRESVKMTIEGDLDQIMAREKKESILNVGQQEGPTADKAVVNARVRSSSMVSVSERDDI
jgi:hypothetical protein